ncbi:MAG: hypothetical protein L3J43_05675 [Sulfurovum sp.]|nr:hypothetical protein [Sulfurovum sp.]
MKKIIQVILCTVPFVAFATTTDELVQIHPLTTAEMASLAIPSEEGALVYDKTKKKLYVYANGLWKELLFNAQVLEKTGDYTLQASDNGTVLTFNSSADITLTVPSGLPVGYNVSIYQIGTGKVTIAGSGVAVKNRLNRFKTAGKDAGVGIVSTSTDVYHLTGDLRR